MNARPASASPSRNGDEPAIRQLVDAFAKAYNAHDSKKLAALFTADAELVDEDANAFNKVMDAFGLAKGSDEEKKARAAAIESATKYAAEIPLKVMETASKSYELLAEMAEKGNPNSISDVGVGICATRACIDGAALNVRINLGQLKDEKFKSALQDKVQKIQSDSESQFKKIDQIVQSKLT